MNEEHKKSACGEHPVRRLPLFGTDGAYKHKCDGYTALHIDYIVEREDKNENNEYTRQTEPVKECNISCALTKLRINVSMVRLGNQNSRQLRSSIAVL